MTDWNRVRPRGGLALLIVVGLGLVACTPNRPAQTPTVPPTGATTASAPVTAPAAPAATAPSGPTYDAPGVVTYDGYQTVRARNGDTVATVASRVGLSGTALGAYNGLPADHQLRDGDELALPPRPSGYGSGAQRGAVTAAATPAPGTPTAGIPAPGTQPIGTTPASGAGGIPVSEDGAPIVAAPGQTAPGAPAAAGAPGWSPELAEAAIARSSGISPDGSLGRPPSTNQPVPEGPAAAPELESPDLGQYQTDAAQGDVLPPPPPPSPAASQQQVASTASGSPAVRMRRPVEGPIAVGFNKGSGPTRNDGVDFAAPAGAKVVAAADGEVALVSESLGGLGTIVLVRHENELLTVYGRIDGVLVQKGDLVQAGQQIGVVSDAAAPAEPRMHFEVRRGAESLNPTQFL